MQGHAARQPTYRPPRSQARRMRGRSTQKRRARARGGSRRRGAGAAVAARSAPGRASTRAAPRAKGWRALGARRGHRCRSGGAARRALDAGDQRGSTRARAPPSAATAARALPSNCGEQHAAAQTPRGGSGRSTPSRKEATKIIAATEHRVAGLDLRLDTGLGGSAMQGERTWSVGWFFVRCAKGATRTSKTRRSSAGNAWESWRTARTNMFASGILRTRRSVWGWVGCLILSASRKVG